MWELACDKVMKVDNPVDHPPNPSISSNSFSKRACAARDGGYGYLHFSGRNLREYMEYPQIWQRYGTGPPCLIISFAS